MMRVTTLKGRDGAVGAMLDYYCGLAEDRVSNQARGPVDYYLDPEEPPGRWWGTGCRALGVGGDVKAPDLRSVLEGHHPDTDRRLGRSFGAGSVRGFDATFSAPKSVSALWALTPDP